MGNVCAKAPLIVIKANDTMNNCLIIFIRLLSKVPKRRQRFICPKIVWLNNSIYNDLMIIQINLFAKQEERKIEKLNRIKSALEKIESLEKAIMVYSNIMAIKKGNKFVEWYVGERFRQINI